MTPDFDDARSRSLNTPAANASAECGDVIK
jgi:hypothetical protein